MVVDSISVPLVLIPPKEGFPGAGAAAPSPGGLVSKGGGRSPRPLCQRGYGGRWRPPCFWWGFKGEGSLRQRFLPLALTWECSPAGSAILITHLLCDLIDPCAGQTAYNAHCHGGEIVRCGEVCHNQHPHHAQNAAGHAHNNGNPLVLNGGGLHSHADQVADHRNDRHAGNAKAGNIHVQFLLLFLVLFRCLRTVQRVQHRAEHSLPPGVLLRFFGIPGLVLRVQLLQQFPAVGVDLAPLPCVIVSLGHHLLMLRAEIVKDVQQLVPHGHGAAECCFVQNLALSVLAVIYRPLVIRHAGEHHQPPPVNEPSCRLVIEPAPLALGHHHGAVLPGHGAVHPVGAKYSQIIVRHRGAPAERHFFSVRHHLDHLGLDLRHGLCNGLRRRLLGDLRYLIGCIELFGFLLRRRRFLLCHGRSLCLFPQGLFGCFQLLGLDPCRHICGRPFLFCHLCPLLSDKRCCIFRGVPPSCRLCAISAGERASSLPLWILRVNDGHAGRQHGDTIDRHRYNHIQTHVCSGIGTDLQLNGSALFHANEHGLVATRSHQPNLVGGHNIHNSGILGAGDNGRVNGHQVHAHVLAQEAVPGPVQTQQGGQGGIQIHGGGVHHTAGQCLGQCGGTANAHHVPVAGPVHNAHPLTGGDPVRGGVGEGHVVGHIGGVGGHLGQGADPQSGDLGIHTGGQSVEEPPHVGIVAHQLIPLHAHPCGAQTGVQSHALVVEGVGGLGAGSAPAVILKEEDVVGHNVQFLGLADGHGGHLSQPAQPGTHDGGQHGGHDLGDDTGQSLEVQAVAHELALVAAELVQISGGDLTTQGAHPLGAEKQQVLLKIAVGHAVAVLPLAVRQHGGEIVGLLGHHAQGALIPAQTLTHQQTTTGHDVGPLPFRVAELRGGAVIHSRIDAVQFDCHCCHSPLVSQPAAASTLQASTSTNSNALCAPSVKVPPVGRTLKYGVPTSVGAALAGTSRPLAMVRNLLAPRAVDTLPMPKR
nr:MAG TPA_asm: hypothetical protein [Caudoviricetes sp.]